MVSSLAASACRYTRPVLMADWQSSPSLRERGTRPRTKKTRKTRPASASSAWLLPPSQPRSQPSQPLTLECCTETCPAARRRRSNEADLPISPLARRGRGSVSARPLALPGLLVQEGDPSRAGRPRQGAVRCRCPPLLTTNDSQGRDRLSSPSPTSLPPLLPCVPSSFSLLLTVSLSLASPSFVCHS